MMRPWASLLRFLIAVIATTLLVVAFNFLVDPLQLFGHRSLLRPAYTSDPRLQDAGLIRSQDYDAVLMGTSLSVHFRQSDIDRTFGVHSVKLAMSGATSVEERFVLNAALWRHPKVVIWELDDRAFFDAADIDSDEFIRPDLYRMNLKGITEYLLGLDTTRESLWVALSAIRPFAAIAHGLAAAQYLKFYGNDVDEIGTLRRDADLSQFYNASLIRSAFAASLKYPKAIYLRYNTPIMVQNFERDFVSVIHEHPEIKFYVFLPPYSILQFVTIREVAPEAIQAISDFSAYAFPRLLALPNVALYDFRDVKDITHHLDNYGDLLHFSPVVGDSILSSLAHGEHAVDRNAPLASIARLREQVAAYDLAAMSRQDCPGGSAGNAQSGCAAPAR